MDSLAVPFERGMLGAEAVARVQGPDGSDAAARVRAASPPPPVPPPLPPQPPQQQQQQQQQQQLVESRRQEDQLIAMQARLARLRGVVVDMRARAHDAVAARAEDDAVAARAEDDGGASPQQAARVARGPSPARAGESSTGPWACARCTLENDARLLICCACEGARPGYTREDKNCRSCGTWNAAGARFCAGCGLRGLGAAGGVPGCPITGGAASVAGALAELSRWRPSGDVGVCPPRTSGGAEGAWGREGACNANAARAASEAEAVAAGVLRGARAERCNSVAPHLTCTELCAQAAASGMVVAAWCPWPLLPREAAPTMAPRSRPLRAGCNSGAGGRSGAVATTSRRGATLPTRSPRWRWRQQTALRGGCSGGGERGRRSSTGRPAGA